jgi:hypothetical protein
MGSRRLRACFVAKATCCAMGRRALVSATPFGGARTSRRFRLHNLLAMRRYNLLRATQFLDYLLGIGYITVPWVQEKNGAVYTKPWVVELILELAEYTPEANLVDAVAVEPAVDDGAFLVPMALRLVQSCRRQRRPILDIATSLRAYELDEASAGAARISVVKALVAARVSRKDACARQCREASGLQKDPPPPKSGRNGLSARADRAVGRRWRMEPGCMPSPLGSRSVKACSRVRTVSE